MTIDAHDQDDDSAGADDPHEMLDGRDSILDELDQCNPELVSDAGYVQLQHSAAIVQAVDESAMSATFTIVTRKSKERNRQGNQVQITEGPLGKGLRTDLGYENAPVVLYDHGMSGVTIPVALSRDKNGAFALKKQAGKATATAFFRALPHSEAIFAAVAEDLLRMASIGFDPLKAMRVRMGRNDPLAEGVEDISSVNRFPGMDFVESEMLEWSITPIGADRGALKQALHRGKIHDVRIPQFLRQSFEHHAGPNAVWSPGADFTRRTIVAAGVTIEGMPENVQAAVERLSDAADQSVAGDAAGVTTVDVATEDADGVDRIVQTDTIQPESTKPQVTAADIASAIRHRKQQASIEPVKKRAEMIGALANEITRWSGKTDAA